MRREFLCGGNLRSNTLGIEILHWSGDRSWCDLIDQVEGQPEQTVACSAGKSVDRLLGTLHGLIFNRKSSQSDRILAALTEKVERVYGEDIPVGPRAIAVGNIPRRSNDGFCSRRSGGIIECMTLWLLILGQLRR
jgi:hypothetical protein